MTYTAKQYEDAVSNLRLAARALSEARHVSKCLDKWEPRSGMTFKVIRGRKHPIGLTGVADFVGENDYGPYVRFTIDGQSQFTALRNVEWPEYIIKREAAHANLDDAEAAMKATSQLVVSMAGIDLSKPLDRGTLRQYAYNDSYEAVYACNPDAPDAVLQAALGVLDPPQSSWGALRWSQGSSLTRREGATCTVHSSTGICD